MADADGDEKQCRICLDGPDPELGKLIRPCLCRGSISYVHVGCLQRWRRESASAFFRCPQCSYQYRTDRTKVAGLASNPVIIAALSIFLFTCLSYVASFVATYLASTLDADEPPRSGSGFYFGFGWDFVSPVEVFYNLMRLVTRILREGDLLEEENSWTRSRTASRSSQSFLGNFIRRVIIGVPVIGVASVIQVLLQFHLLGPLNMLARHRGRNRRETSRDLAMLVIILAIIVGIFRALRAVYRLTERLAKYLLLRAEDAIVEVA